MQRPLPPDILRVIELGRRGYSLREIAERLGYSYGYLRNKLYRLRRRGYDIPIFSSGRRGRSKVVFKGFTQKILPERKLSPVLKNRGERSEQYRVRLGVDGLTPHVVSMVLYSGGLHAGEIYRRLRMWGFEFSRSTLWRCIRRLELYGYVVVDHARGPRGNFIRPSQRLVFVSLHGSRGGGDVLGVIGYVENPRRRWEYGFEFVGVGPVVSRWAQMYFRGGRWRVEFKPFRGREPDRVAFVRDLVRVAVLVSLVVGIPYRELVGIMAEEWARLQSPLLRGRGET